MTMGEVAFLIILSLLLGSLTDNFVRQRELKRRKRKKRKLYISQENRYKLNELNREIEKQTKLYEKKRRKLLEDIEKESEEYYGKEK